MYRVTSYNRLVSCKPNAASLQSPVTLLKDVYVTFVLLWYLLTNVFLLPWSEHFLAQFSSLKRNLLSDLQVVYFGDSMHSDIFPARHYSNWETVLILEELRGDRDGKPEESEPLEKKGKYEVRIPFSSLLERKTFMLMYLRKSLFVPRVMKPVGIYGDLLAISALLFILLIIFKWCQDDPDHLSSWPSAVIQCCDTLGDFGWCWDG